MPEANDAIRIIKKKRSIKLSVVKIINFVKEITLNDNLLGWYPNWINEDDWDSRKMAKFVKKCDKETSKRFKVNYN